jgi:hypothetical protein
MVLSTIGRHLVFSLGGWSPLLPADFLVIRGTLDTGLLALLFVYVALTPYGLPFQVVRLSLTSIMPVRNPAGPKSRGLGSAHFARRYCGYLA